MNTATLGRPEIHVLCSGAFVQARSRLADHIEVVPLQPLGLQAEADFTIRYAQEMGAAIDSGGASNLMNQGAASRSAIAVVVTRAVHAAPEELERDAWTDVERALSVVGWLAGEVPSPFAIFTVTSGATHFRLLTPNSKWRHHLPLSGNGHGLEGQLQSLFQVAGRDERFAFALGVFRDSLKERVAEFKVARQFSCLEALSYRIGGGRESPRVCRRLG